MHADTVEIRTSQGRHSIRLSILVACLRSGKFMLDVDFDRAIDALDAPDYDPDDPNPPPFKPVPEIDAMIDEQRRIQALIDFLQPPEPPKEPEF